MHHAGGHGFLDQSMRNLWWERVTPSEPVMIHPALWQLSQHALRQNCKNKKKCAGARPWSREMHNGGPPIFKPLNIMLGRAVLEPTLRCRIHFGTNVDQNAASPTGRTKYCISSYVIFRYHTPAYGLQHVTVNSRACHLRSAPEAAPYQHPLVALELGAPELRVRLRPGSLVHQNCFE